jgi:hypothetical protein
MKHESVRNGKRSPICGGVQSNKSSLDEGADYEFKDNGYWSTETKGIGAGFCQTVSVTGARELRVAMGQHRIRIMYNPGCPTGRY